MESIFRVILACWPTWPMPWRGAMGWPTWPMARKSVLAHLADAPHDEHCGPLACWRQTIWQSWPRGTGVGVVVVLVMVLVWVWMCWWCGACGTGLLVHYP